MRSEAKYNAFDTALYYLTFKGRTKKELYDKLKEKGYCPSEIEASVSKLEEYGYIDDEGYTFSYIKSNLSRKGKKRIRMELIQKGIDRKIVEDGLNQFSGDEETEEAAIEAIFKRRFAHMDCLDRNQQRKIFSYFARRGFAYENITRTIASLGKISDESDGI